MGMESQGVSPVIAWYHSAGITGFLRHRLVVLWTGVFGSCKLLA